MRTRRVCPATTTTTTTAAAAPRWWCTAAVRLLTVAALVARCSGRPAAVDAGAGDPAEPTVPVQLAVIEVAQGETAVLQCPSNDKDHRFQFWWMKPDQIIGPGTVLNTEKFKYEVLTGTLYIKVRINRGRYAIRFVSRPRFYMFLRLYFH